MDLMNPDAAPETAAVRPTIRPSAPGEAVSLRDISSHQWKSGIAAWLGWLFDGLDMHLYTLVASVYVAQLLGPERSDAVNVKYYSSWIQASFLIGWALGGGFFGVIGDRLGRTRTLMLTILTYALFTGLSSVAQTWWHLLIFRFVAALGIGGEWAVGASLLSETWPKRWRPWMAAVLQTGVNIGVVMASVAVFLMSSDAVWDALHVRGTPLGFLAENHHRWVFLVGVLPALMVLWIRKAVPETGEWQHARAEHGGPSPRFLDLFRGNVRRISVLTLLVCAFSLTAHWAFTFWSLQHVQNLPDFPKADGSSHASVVMMIIMVSSIVGNFLAAALARRFGYRRSIAFLCPAYFVSLIAVYSVARSYHEMCLWLILPGLCQGVFALFTMYLPPLFPTLLRTSGAGFCYNFGRIAAALGTVFFGRITPVHDYRQAIMWASTLFIPAALFACLLPEPPDEAATPWNAESVEPEV